MFSVKGYRGTTLGDLTSSFGVSRPSIYYYYKKLYGKKYKSPEIKKDFSRNTGEIIGIFTGDGSKYYYKPAGGYEVNVHFGGRNKEYAFYVKNLFESKFKKKFGLHKDTTKLRLRIRSKDIYFFPSHL